MAGVRSRTRIIDLPSTVICHIASFIVDNSTYCNLRASARDLRSAMPTITGHNIHPSLDLIVPPPNGNNVTFTEFSVFTVRYTNPPNDLTKLVKMKLSGLNARTLTFTNIFDHRRQDIRTLGNDNLDLADYRLSISSLCSHWVAFSGDNHFGYATAVCLDGQFGQPGQMIGFFLESNRSLLSYNFSDNRWETVLGPTNGEGLRFSTIISFRGKVYAVERLSPICCILDLSNRSVTSTDFLPQNEAGSTYFLAPSRINLYAVKRIGNSFTLFQLMDNDVFQQIPRLHAHFMVVGIHASFVVPVTDIIGSQGNTVLYSQINFDDDGVQIHQEFWVELANGIIRHLGANFTPYEFLRRSGGWGNAGVKPVIRGVMEG